MLRLTPEQFRARLVMLANESGTVMERATKAAAWQVKKDLVFSAQTRVRRTPKARPGWVKYVVSGNPTGATAKIYPRGGFAILAEMGSYKKPTGYVVPRPGKRRRRGSTGWRGPFEHPAIKAQPWWSDGWDRAKPKVERIYYEAEAVEVRKQFG